MTSIPTGTITFLFTDIEGSTRLWQEFPQQMQANLARHDALLRTAIEQNEGYVFKTVGDAFCAAFPTALQGVKAAIEAQYLLASENWGECVIKVRMGLHTGDAEQRDNDYFGNTLNRAARMMSAGHGGQILLSLATQELVRDKLPEGATLADLGERRLKDLIRPEHIYQLNAPGLDAVFAPLKTLETYRHNLPAQLTSFIGREKEMTEIKQAIAEHRLVTLTGPGGTGKTRLSLQVAADLLDQFPNGIWFVELAPLTDPDLIAQTALSAVGMQAQSGKTAQQSLLDFLSEKTALLVLDNCEHLIEASARLAGTLLAAAPNLKILASSREVLGIGGEMVWRVPSLSLPDIKHLPDTGQISQYEAVRLFIERARLVQPHFMVADQNAPAIAQICHRLDGIPLALELAAARMRMLSADEIAARLDDRFRLLTGGSRTALPRQQTLRALIDWSYDLLSEHERTLLRRLAAFSNGCTLQAAEQVCRDEEQAGIASAEVLDLITRLVEKSLVALEERPTQSRYRVLETVRQYAREKLLESGEGEQIRQQQFEYFFNLAATAEPYIHYGPRQILWLDQLDEELDNFYAALEWSLGNKLEAGAQLVTKLWWFWDLRGHWLEGYEWTQRALEITPGATSLRAELLAEAGWLASELRYIQRAVASSAESAALYRSLGDRAGLAFPLIILGDEARDQANFIQAKEFFAESYTLFGEANNKWGSRQVMLNGWAMFADFEHDYVEMERIGHEALAISRELEDKEGICYSLHILAKQAIFTHNYDRANSYYQEALLLAREARYADMLARIIRHMGQLAIRIADYDQAKNLFEEYLQINRELGNKNDTAFALRLLGQVARKQKDYREALRLYTECIKLAQGIEEKRQVFGSLLELAFLRGELGNYARSILLFGVVETLYPIVYKGMYPDFFDECEEIKAVCLSNLGQESFNIAYAEGQAMLLEQAVAYALQDAV